MINTELTSFNNKSLEMSIICFILAIPYVYV